MKTDTLATLRDRKPFRPFALRVNSGAIYEFNQPQQFGATGNLQLIVHFTETKCTTIDAESITEIIEDTPFRS
jgi:hypothetical protein